MPRQQSGGVVKGGGIDPYVAAMSQTRQMQGGDMRKAAMQEQQATKRQGMSNDAQVAQANIQAAAAKDMQDKSMAAAEKGRREEMEFRTMQEASANKAQLERDVFLDDLDTAREEKRWDKVKVLTQQLDDEARYQDITAQVRNANNAKLVRNIGAANGKARTATAKLNTQQDQQLKKHGEMRGIAATASEVAITSLTGTNFNYKGQEAISMYDKFKGAVTNLAAPLAAVIPGVTMKGLAEGREKSLQYANNRIISEEFNKVLASNGVGQVSVEMLTKDKIREVEDLISEGKLGPEDFVPLHATLAAAQKTFTAKAEEANRGKGDEASAAADFYAQWATKMVSAQHRLRQLDYAKTSIKMQGEQTIVVGSVARQGNLWSGEFDPDWFDAQRSKIASERDMEIEEFGNVDSMPPVYPSINSPFVSERDRQRPYLMGLVRDRYLKAADTMGEQHYPSQE